MLKRSQRSPPGSSDSRWRVTVGLVGWMTALTQGLQEQEGSGDHASHAVQQRQEQHT